MQEKVFCKTTAKGTQSFYVTASGKEIFLFSQDYRASNKEFFRNGVHINNLGKYTNIHSASVRKVLDKLPSYIRYVEKEYGVEIYQKTKKGKTKKKANPYKREKFRWQDYLWEVA